MFTQNIEFKYQWSSFDLYKDESRALIMEWYKSKKSCLKRLGYWADLNNKEERTYTDKRGLISALICNN